MAFGRLTRGKLNFLLGFTAGILIAIFLTSYTSVTTTNSADVSNLQRHLRLDPVHGHPDPNDFSMDDILDAVHGDSGERELIKDVKFEDLHVHHDDDTVARDMASKIRVLVWIMTGPQNLDAKAIHVRKTWGQRVNKLLFMSSQWNNTFPTIGLNVSEGREHLTAKTMQAFRYVYEHHFDDADWFMKADDDTYVIMENLRYMLSAYDTNEPIFFGHVFHPKEDKLYASGGAGYVLSKEAMRRLGSIGLKNETLCKPDGGSEDVAMGRCLKGVGVKLEPSLDRLGRSRFHCFGPEGHMRKGYPKWYYTYDANGAKSGLDSMSDYPISFHYVSGPRMYVMEFYVYHLRSFGIISKFQNLNMN